MHLSRLALTDFRSYAAADLELSAGVTTFTGANGQGKTNLVEAAAYAATFGSHRVATDAPLIRHGAERAIIRAMVTSAVRDSLIEIEVNAGKANRVRLNRVPLPRPREALGTLRCVLFAPEDLAVVKGDPDQRRRYLDDLLVATRPRFAGVRTDYERVLRQRTALLKSARAPAARAAMPSALEVWDEHLVEKGAELTAGRLGLVAALRPLVAKAYAAVSGEDMGAGMSYRQAGPGAARGLPPRPPARTAIRRRTGRPSPTRCARRWSGPARPSSSAASAWSARTGTSSSCASASCPRAATLAMASRGRSRLRSGWPPMTCCDPAVKTRC